MEEAMLEFVALSLLLAATPAAASERAARSSALQPGVETASALVRTRGSVQFQPRPDLCVSNQLVFEDSVQVTDIDGVGNAVRIFEDTSSAGPGTPPVVLIINGNSFHAGMYWQLASFLARQGFIAVVGERPSNSNEDPQFVLDALDAAFAELGYSQATPVALVGHSVGGGVVVNAAVLNQTSDAGYEIKAVVGRVNHLTNLDAQSYLLIYGSQDEDMGGTSGVPREAFAAYDRAGTEESTTCASAFCGVQAPGPSPLDRTMIYVHGADHRGLIGNDQGFTGTDPEFIHHEDQFCIAKAYTAGFLRWKLLGDTIFKGMLRDAWRPASVNAMVSSESDHLGNPSGTDLRMFFQISPPSRFAVENFEDGDFDVTDQSAGVSVQLNEPGELATSPTYVRHETNLLIAAWEEHDEYQLLGLSVPANARNASAFKKLALRIGQLWGSPVPNPEGEYQEVLIGLYDGDVSEWEWLNDWGDIAPNDPRSSGAAHSGMSTIAIPTGAFDDVDLTHIERILFAFPAGSQGTVLIDSLEWWKE
jgi:pimeloyl-ACP methyl ester carboxylesterase